MRRLHICIVVTLLGCVVPSFAQEYLYELTLIGSFTTSSKLFRHPDDADEIIRSQFLRLDNIFGAGIDLRRTIEPLAVQIGLSVEYLSKTELFDTSGSRTIPVKDGYTTIPIELSGYFFIPIGDENIRFYMGGGGGTYLGSRRYEYAGARARTIERIMGYGIHVLSGLLYKVSPRISLRSEIKFRDVQFETVNKFTQQVIVYRGTPLYLDQEPFASRINIDGMALTVGIAVHF
ncbi:MAG: hypothetical protein HY707_14745 [Ignavibacteriae bacterium]|nr:hypothetical protein [Ignavibacteriota bacterium]